MKIYLVRHGESTYNVRQLNNDDPKVDVRITEKGVAQAQELADMLRDEPIDVVYVSELQRTQQTAAIINEPHGAQILVDARLNDNKSGFESRPHQEYVDALNAAPDIWNARFNGGESFMDVKARVQSFMAELRQKPYKVVLIVTSRTIVQTMYGLITGIGDELAHATPAEPGSYIETYLDE